jgi:tetratricopeptide (TPR) repeat protein
MYMMSTSQESHQIIRQTYKRLMKILLVTVIFLLPTIISASNSFYASALNGFNEENFEKAIKYLEKDIVFNPKSSESYILLGRSYEGLEDKDNALKYYEIAFTLIPHNLELNFLIGKVSYELGLIEQYAEQITNLEILCETSCEEIVKLKDLAE